MINITMPTIFLTQTIITPTEVQPPPEAPYWDPGPPGSSNTDFLPQDRHTAWMRLTPFCDESCGHR